MEPQIITQSEEAVQEARETLQDLHLTIDAINQGEIQLSSSYVHLGKLLLKVRSKKYWIDWEHESFGSFIQSVETRIKKGRSQIYDYIGTVEKLLPIVGEERMEQMGISSASELARYVRQTGKIPTEELLSLAETGETEDLRAAVFEATHGEPPPKQKFWNYGGFYLTEDENQTIMETLRLGCQLDPVVLFDWNSPSCRKEILMRMVQECASTWHEMLRVQEGA
jgi:hypothetical protein